MARKRVKTYDYIKRSDISVLKATIDGKVLNVDPKKILSGTYVAGKIKPTAKKLRVAKLDPASVRTKLLNRYEEVAKKDYNKDFENYVNIADIKKFIECGLTEEMIMAFYGGFQSIMEIKADNEFVYKPIGGIFDFRTDEDGKWIKSYIERGLYNCEQGVFELGFKYPSFEWRKVGFKTPKTDIIETVPYEFFGKEKISILRIETFNVKTTFKVLAIKAVGDIKDGERVARSGEEKLLDPKQAMELNGGYLALVSRNGKELFALAKKLLSQEGAYVKDFEWLVQNKTAGAEELKDKNYKFAKGGVTEHGLAKGDTITDDLFWENRAVVTDKDGKKVIVDLEKGKRGVKFAKGGAIETITRLNGNRQEYTLPLPKVVILAKHLNDTYLDWVKENTGLEFKKTAWAYEAQPKTSNQIVTLILMSRTKLVSFHNNATNKNTLFMKFFRDDFMQYEFGGGIEDVDFMSAARTSARESIDWSEELRNYAGENYDSLSESEKESIIAEMKADWDFQHSFKKGGKVRTMQKGDAVLYRDETWYVTEKDGVVGIMSMRQGAWGSNYPFIPLTKIYQEQELTDMSGRKVFIPYSFDKANVGMLVAAKQAKEVAPKSVDAIDSKIAERVSKKTFWERMNEPYPSNRFAKGGNLGDTLLSKIKIGNIIPTNQGNFEIIGFEEETTKLDIYDGGFSYFKVKDENGEIKYIKISREKNPKMFLNNGSLMSASWENAKRIFAKGGMTEAEKKAKLIQLAKERGLMD